MKEQPRLADMIKNAAFDGFLLVRNAQQRTASNGSKYLDMTLTDISGDVNAKMWDGLTPAPASGTVIRVRGVMQEYNGRAQFRVDKMRQSNSDDDIDMQRLIPCAPRPADDMLDEILNRADAIRDKELKALDLTATTFCMDNDIHAYAFELKDPMNIYRVIMGEKIGTEIHR